MRALAVIGFAAAAAFVAPASAFAGASVFVTCNNYPDRPGCKKNEPAAPTNTKTTWEVDVVPADAGEYSSVGSKLAKTQSDDFVGGH